MKVFYDKYVLLPEITKNTILYYELMSILEFQILTYEYPQSVSNNTTIFGKLMLQKARTHVIMGLLEYCIFVDKKEGYITRLRIGYLYQGNHFATALLQAFLEYAKQKNLSVIMASIEPDPLDAYNDLVSKYGYESWEDTVYEEDSEEATHFIKEQDLLIHERFVILKKIFFKAGFVECENLPQKEKNQQLTVILYL